METKAQALAAHFEECARVLRAHPELFDDQALENVGVVAGLSTRVVRLAARRTPLPHIIRDISGLLLHGLVVAAGKDRLTLGLLAGARRGYLRAVERAMLAERRRHPLFTLSRDAAGTVTVASHCPRCDDLAERDLREPAACFRCGFEFEPVLEEEVRDG